MVMLFHMFKDPLNCRIGDYLFDLKDEFGEYSSSSSIDEFVSGGQTNYAY